MVNNMKATRGSKKPWALLAGVVSSLSVIFAIGLSMQMGDNNKLAIATLFLIAIAFIMFLASVVSAFMSLGFVFGFLAQILNTIIFATGIVLIQLEVISFSPITYIIDGSIFVVISIISLVKSTKG